jgi:hypothetical protein
MAKEWSARDSLQAASTFFSPGVTTLFCLQHKRIFGQRIYVVTHPVKCYALLAHIRPTENESTWVQGIFSEDKRGRGVLLTTHPLLASWVRRKRGYTSSPPMCQNWHATGNLYPFLPSNESILGVRWQSLRDCSMAYEQIWHLTPALKFLGQVSFLVISVQYKAHFMWHSTKKNH